MTNMMEKQIDDKSVEKQMNTMDKQTPWRNRFVSKINAERNHEEKG